MFNLLWIYFLRKLNVDKHQLVPDSPQMDPKYEPLLIPPDIFDIIINKYPTLDIDSDDGSSRWHFMNTLEHAYWYIVDYVIHSIINRENFFRAFINDLYYQRKKYIR